MTRKGFVLFSFCVWANSVLFAQTPFKQAVDSTKVKSIIIWSIAGYSGFHTSSFSAKSKKNRDFSSSYNFGVDLKREFRPNLFLVLSNRVRTDTYYRSGMFFAYPSGNPEWITKSVFSQAYFINSHALMVEDVFHFRRFDFFVSGGLGINFMNPFSDGMYQNNEIYDGLNYTSSFTDLQFSWNSFWVLNGGVGFRLNERWRLDVNFSFSKDITSHYQLMGISVQKDNNLFVLPVSWPRTQHLWVFPGISYRF